MSWLDGITHRIRRLLRPSEFRRELDDEMRFHLELDAQQQRDARRFGNRTYYKEETRRMTWLGALDPLRQDVVYTWRSITRAPGFTALVTLTLALGIGATAALFSFIDRLYLRPPAGIQEPATLRRIWTRHFNMSDGPFAMESMSYKRFAAISDAIGDQSTIAAYTTDNALRQGRAVGAPRIRGVYATANYFEVLGVVPALGRFFGPDEDRLGNRSLVAVVSYAFWKRRLAGDSSAVGKSIMIGREPHVLIGVAQPRFAGLDLQSADVWMPLASLPHPGWRGLPWWQTDHTHWVHAALRLSAAFSALDFELRATRNLREVNRAETTMGRDSAMTVHVGSIIEARGPGDPSQEQAISTRLAGVAAVVLLIACANVINLLLARAVSRRRETAVRLTLGISRRRLIRLLALEGVILAAIAAVGAALAAWWGGTLLRALLIPSVEWSDSALHWRVVVFTVAVALLAGLVAALIPALQASKPQLTHDLKASVRDGGRRSRLRGGLLIMQAALSVLLLAGAGLFVRSLVNVRGLDIGYDSGRLLFGSVEFEEGEAPPDPVLDVQMRGIALRLEGNAAIEAIGRASLQPMDGATWAPFYFGTDSSQSLGRRAPATWLVSPGFFRAAGIRVVRGSGLSSDDGPSPASEVVVNEAMANLAWPGRDPLGECIRFQRVTRPACHTVVGIVENVRLKSVIESEPVAQLYIPLGTHGWDRWPGSTLLVRAGPQATAAASSALSSSLRSAFPAAETTVKPMSEALEPEYRPWKLGATLFTAFGILALLVAVVGIYSTVSYSVSQRTHEFGVRMALGARLHNVLQHVVGSGLRPVAAGVLLGLILTLAAGRLIASLLYGVRPHDPLVMMSVAVLLLVVAGLAALTPAWRAARVDPVMALKAE